MSYWLPYNLQEKKCCEKTPKIAKLKGMNESDH